MLAMVNSIINVQIIYQEDRFYLAYEYFSDEIMKLEKFLCKEVSRNIFDMKLMTLLVNK